MSPIHPATNSAMSDHVIDVRDLRVHFAAGRRTPPVRAIDGFSLSVRAGESHAVVGESGCGKTTMARAILGLQSATSGEIRIRDRDLSEWMNDRKALAREMQFVFQNPLGALSRRQTVEQSLEEPLLIHRVGDRQVRWSRIRELIELVGLPASLLDRLPRSLSGGQRQRVAIARALALDPRILICDEPLSALDVSIQAQIVTLFLELQRTLGLTIVMISHDLAVVRQMCSTVTVMYLGKVVETGETRSLFARPAHPYTQALISAVPSPDPRVEATRTRIVLAGDPPSPVTPPPGCRFNTRCVRAEILCRQSEPALLAKSTGTRAACHLAD